MIMNPLRKLQYRTRVGMLLAILLVGLLLNNIAGQESFSEIEKNANAIYEDRLMPATFIFELREHLDQERILIESARHDAQSMRAQSMNQHAIADLVGKYEKTKLTKEERLEWDNFKSHLQQYYAGADRQTAFIAHYGPTLKSLNHLSLIQAGEGRHIRSNMNAIVSASSLRSYLELAFIIAIGSITLSLIGHSRGIFEQTPPHSPSLN